MLSKLRGNNGTTPTPEQPAAPSLPARRQRGEQYAQALSEYKELEGALDDAVSKLDDALAHIKGLEAQLGAVRTDNNQLLADRDWHRDRYVELKTRLNSIATHFLDCVRDNEPVPIQGVSEYAPKSPQQAQIASALTEVEKELLQEVEQKAAERPPA